MDGHQDDNRERDLVRKNQRMGLLVLLTVVIMTGLSFAAVPLYTLFCRVTGFGGTTQVAQTLPDEVLERTITVKFDASTARGLDWEFEPGQREIIIRVGERGLITYRAHNKTDKPAAGTALYNVTPLKAGKYFQKIECFCFSEQMLGPGEEATLPVMFYIDPALDKDPAMYDVGAITLSYTFFPAESEALDRALEAFYNSETGAGKSADF